MICKSCKLEYEPMYHNGILVSRFCIPCLSKKGKAKQAKEWKKEKAILKKKINGQEDDLVKLQKEINTIVRLIDKDTFCHSTRTPLRKKYDAGHVYPVSGSGEIRYNLFNIYAQSVHANQHLKGDQANYLETLNFVFGAEHEQYVRNLRSMYTKLNFKMIDLPEKIKIARKIVKELRVKDERYSNEERLALRKEYNDRIGIYK